MKFIKKINALRIILLTLLCIFLLIAFLNFERTSYVIITDSFTRSLKEAGEFYARTFEMKINDQLVMLESQTRFFSDVDMNDTEQMTQVIMSTKGIGEFKTIAVANASGNLINSKGGFSGYIKDEDYFNRVMASGYPSISPSITVDEEGDSVLVLAVPIIQNSETVGVITGTFSYSILSSLFSVDFFEGYGYSYILANDGYVIVGNNSEKSLLVGRNIFNFIVDAKGLSQEKVNNIQKNMVMNDSDTFSLHLNGKERFCYYTPVGVNDWYVFSFVESDYIKSMQKKISFSVYALVGLIVLIFAYIIIIMVDLLRNRRAVEKNLEKYTIATQQNQTIVFEYDIKAQKINFQGNYQSIIGEVENPIDLIKLRESYANIHEDDVNVMAHLNEFFKDDQTSFTSELRYKCMDGNYRWYRLNGSVITDKDSKSQKFVGTFIDVDAQVTHEQELRKIAETDLLSGLLNKSFFQRKVSKYMETALSDAENKNKSEKTIEALFIIDLDNFKKTNDTLGHAMGDIAIRDAAQKIALIFSPKDFLGRIGGDEFCVFLRLDGNLSNEMAEKIILQKAETLKESLMEYYNNDKFSVQVSASIGIALFPLQGTDYEDIFCKADTALYYVKHNGKNNYAIYNDKMDDVPETLI